MPDNFEIESGFIAEQNSARGVELAEEFDHLRRKLGRRGIDIDAIVEKARGLRVAIPLVFRRSANFLKPMDSVRYQLKICRTTSASCSWT